MPSLTMSMPVPSRSRSARPARGCSSPGRSTRRPGAGPRSCRRRRSRRPRAASTPILPMRSRSASSTAGAGDSSMSFWWRRWTEQSRSPRWIELPWRVGEDLDLDVARVGQVALEVDRRVGEELLALARGALEGLLQLGLVERDAEALAAAAARGLDRDRVADVGVDDLAARPRRSRPARWCPGTIGTPASCISSRARVLEPIASIALAGGPMKTMPASSHARANGGVLGQEAVAGMHGLGARLLADLEDLLDVEIALGRGRPASR